LRKPRKSKVVIEMEKTLCLLNDANIKLIEEKAILQKRLGNYFFNDGYLAFIAGIEFDKYPHEKEEMKIDWEAGWKQAKKDSKNENT